MIAKTGKQLAGTKRNGRRKPVAEATKTRTKKGAGAAAAAGVAKVGKTVGQKPGTKKVSVKKSGSRTPRPKPVESTAAELENNATPSIDSSTGIETSHGIETAEVQTAEIVVDAGANENESDSADKAAGNSAASSSGNGEQVKSLTEAGKKRLVNKLLGLADSQATQGAFKITPADLIRLMQLHREMHPQKDRKVTVQWIEDKPE
jgi:hypothetical protein